MPNPKLLLPTDYVKEATREIEKAKHHVSFLCMVVTDDSQTDHLISALSAAARRGVTVEVAADVFTYGELGGHFIPFKYYTKRSRETTKMAKQLRRNGVKFTWLGRFSTMPFTGRTHSKCLVVDDTVYSFGGVNLYDVSIAYTDYMFRYTDKLLALALRDEISRLIAADNGHFTYRSHSFTHGAANTILIDGGFQGDSVIYRRACQLTKQASSVIFVSQYCPFGRLNRAMKNTDAKLYFNNPSGASFWNKVVIKGGRFLSDNTTLYTRPQYLHAKFIIFTMPDGKKVAITGSHNFMPGSVLLGTREIALETTDKKIIRQLEDFFEKYVK